MNRDEILSEIDEILSAYGVKGVHVERLRSLYAHLYADVYAETMPKLLAARLNQALLPLVTEQGQSDA